MTILEAWAAGTPTIMTAACHLPEGFSAGAAIECGADSASIAGAVTDALALDHARWHTMSEAAQELARGPFSSEQVARQWIAAYSELAGR